MEIVDAQIHVWGTGLPGNPSHWPVTSFTVAEAVAMMDEANVDAAVIHPPSWDPGAVDMALDAVRDHPGRFAIMGSLPLDAPASRERLPAWRDQAGMLGLRYTALSDPMRTRMNDGSLSVFDAYRVQHNQGLGPFIGPLRVSSDLKLDELRERQIDTVRYLDGVFEQLYDMVPKNTHIIVTADHGELFGEAGYFGHGPIMHDKCFEVPYLEGRIR